MASATERHFEEIERRLGPTTVYVELAGRDVTLPDCCVCCCAEPETTMKLTSTVKSIETTRTFSGTATTLSFDALHFPACARCAEHVRIHDDSWSCLLLLAIFLATFFGAWGAHHLFGWSGVGGELALGAALLGVTFWGTGRLHRSRLARVLTPDCATLGIVQSPAVFHGGLFMFRSARYGEAFRQANPGSQTRTATYWRGAVQLPTLPLSRER
jgi:hypothetical protein